MRVFVVSDTHGSVSRLERAVMAAGVCGAYIHLGDHASDGEYLARLADAPTYIVRGNCDIASDQPSERLIELEGTRLLLTHGHKYGVKQGIDRLAYRGMELGAQVLLFGHTHTPLCLREDGMLFCNPGAGGYAILTVKEGKTDFRVFCI